MEKAGIGVVGCGNISGIYLKNLTTVFKNTEVVACADLVRERAEAAAKEWNIAKVVDADTLLRDRDVQIVLNLTTPDKHYAVCREALMAGKHVYSEKPMALTYAQGKELYDLAREKGLFLGGAPDTFMGAGISTCRKLIDDGFIGKVTAATAFMVCHGHESWHPDPEFYYAKGGGPLFDMGPYYLTALVSLIGGVSEVCGMSGKAFEKRVITSEKKFGKQIHVETDTHLTGLLRFENGAIGTIVMSFDVWNSKLPCIELYGTKGTLIVPDPNCFGGPVLLSTRDGGGFKEIPLTHPYADNFRGLGVSDMADCILNGRAEMRASSERTLHVLEIMEAIEESGKSKKYHCMRSTCGRPEPCREDALIGSV